MVPIAAKGEIPPSLFALAAAALEREQPNPLHPSWYHTDIATSLHAAGQYREAIAHLQMLPRIDPFWHTRLAACHAALGDTEAAARHMAEAKKISPGWDPVEEYRQGLEVEHPESLEPILRDIEMAVAAWHLHCG